MKIEKIESLRNCAVFRDFDWPSGLDPFADYNLIYGCNGTGKTTLSRVFRAFELRDAAGIPGDFEVRVDGKTYTNNSFLHASNGPNIPNNIRVFNRDFVDSVVFRSESGLVAPIFVFGERNVEAQQDLDALRDKLQHLDKDIIKYEEDYKRSKADEDKYRIDNARNIKNLLLLLGDTRAANYDKAKLQQDLDKLKVASDPKPKPLNDDERNDRTEICKSEKKASIAEIQYELPDLQSLKNEINEILAKTVVSRVIESLREDNDLAIWVHSGLNIHRDRNEKSRCLFCQQPLDLQRIKDLEDHFNDEYDNLIKEIDDKVKDLNEKLEDIENIEYPDKAAFFTKLSDKYEAEAKACTEMLETIRKYVVTLNELLDDKQKCMFARLKPYDTEPPVIKENRIDNVNKIICDHNTMAKNADEQKETAREEIRTDEVLKLLPEYQEKQKDIQSKKSVLADALENRKPIEKEINELEMNLISHRKPAEEWNRNIHDYLGHDELKVLVEKTGYAIVRGDERAKSLSEGEQNAIALLYFLCALNDKNFDRENGVVVLDDPVSSLDTNSLYYAQSFIGTHTKDIGQLFIMTHNVTLLRYIKNWFGYKNRQEGKHEGIPCQYYMLDYAYSDGTRNGKIGYLDSLLADYDSEYHYLFSRIYREARIESKNLEEYYPMPNIARRVLEMFLAFRYPKEIKTDSGLYRALMKTPLDEAKKKRIDRYTNDLSHGRGIGSHDHDPSILGETSAVLRDILLLVKLEDPCHYQGMIELIEHRTNTENA